MSLLVEEVVVVLPVEDEGDEVTILQRSEEHPDVQVGHVGLLMRGVREILLEDDDAYLNSMAYPPCAAPGRPCVC